MDINILLKNSRLTGSFLDIELASIQEIDKTFLLAQSDCEYDCYTKTDCDCACDCDCDCDCNCVCECNDCDCYCRGTKPGD